MEKENPLIIVFYLDRYMMQETNIIIPFTESVNKLIEEKEANMMAFFLPCAEGESERVECINPKLVEETEMVRINKIISDIQTAFSVNATVDVVDEKITTKPCTCGDNPDGNCEC